MIGIRRTSWNTTRCTAIAAVAQDDTGEDIALNDGAPLSISERPHRDGQNPSEEEPPDKRPRTGDSEHEVLAITESWVMEVKTHVLEGQKSAAQRMHISEGIQLSHLEEQTTDSRKIGHATAHAAKIAEVRGLMKM